MTSDDRPRYAIERSDGLRFSGRGARFGACWVRHDDSRGCRSFFERPAAQTEADHVGELPAGVDVRVVELGAAELVA